MERRDLKREEIRGTLPLAARAVGIGQDEDLVHAHVKRLRLAGSRKLIDQIEKDGVHFRVQRTVATAVDPLVVRVLPGRLIEFRVLLEESIRPFRPGLMPEAVDLRNELDPLLATGLCNRGNLILAGRARIRELGPRLEVESVVELEDECVDALLGQCAANERDERRHILLPGRAHVHAANG